MKSTRSRFAFGLTLLLGLFHHTSSLWAVPYVWDGTGDGFSWDDPSNWDLDLGFPSTTSDTATFNGAANVTMGLPQTINRLFTGTGLVQLNGSLNFGPNVSPNGPVVGTGGLSVTGSLGGQMRDFSSNGNVTVTGSMSMFAFFPQQTGGTWDITTLILPNNTGTIPAWNFVDGANTTITTSFTAGTYTFTGTPTFTGGRPDWTFTGGANHIIQLGNQTIYGDVLTLNGWPGPPATRHTELHANGGTLDVNRINILVQGNSSGSFLDIDNGSILLQDTTGLVWNNQTDANTLFDVATNTTVTFAAGANVSIDTGSVDLGLSETAFMDNFAFDLLSIPTGSIVTLTGGDYLSGPVNALYANNIIGGGTLALNGHNLYLYDQVGNDVLFDFTGGGEVFYLNTIPVPEPSSWLLLGLGALLLPKVTARRRSLI